MNLPPELIQFIGSLIAIFALAGLAHWLKLGRKPKLINATQAQIAADEVCDGYVPNQIALDVHGEGAIMQDALGHVLVLKRHGNKFAGRILEPIASATVEGRTLTIHSGERRYGKVIIKVEDPHTWADTINTLGSLTNA